MTSEKIHWYSPSTKILAAILAPFAMFIYRVTQKVKSHCE